MSTPKFNETHNGSYYYSSGSHYQGEMKDGQFHGQGTLFYKNGAKWTGIFENGIAKEGTYIFPDGLKFVQNFPTDNLSDKHVKSSDQNFDENSWDYCIRDDRRFFSEWVDGMKPAGRSQLSNNLDTPKIPKNSYDVGDGYYLPEERTVYSYEGQWRRIADDDEHEFILRYCKKGWDTVVGVLDKKGRN